MSNTLLTEQQSACRAAHEQVQMLQDLYKRLLGDEDERHAVRFRLDQRTGELLRDRNVLARKLEELDLLRTEPDPEREGILEVITELKRAFSLDDDNAVGERLIHEEQELLQLAKQLAQHDEDDAVAEIVRNTGEAIRHLESLAPREE